MPVITQGGIEHKLTLPTLRLERLKPLARKLGAHPLVVLGVDPQRGYLIGFAVLLEQSFKLCRATGPLCLGFGVSAAATGKVDDCL